VASSSVAASKSARPPAPAPSPAVRVDASRIERDIRLIAAPRQPGSEHHARVRALCKERLEHGGYQVEMHDYGSGVNVVGSKAGGSDERVILSAHYDHVAGCSGADDNASGVAVVLEAARVLAAERAKRPRTLVVALWDEEESSLLGSAAYAARAKQRAERIVLMMSLDAVGMTNKAPGSQRLPAGFDRLFPRHAAEVAARQHRGDFLAALGDADAAEVLEAFKRHGKTVGLPVVAIPLSTLEKLLLLDAQRSDHASFSLNGFTSLLLTDTAEFRNPRYHCREGDDHADTVDYTFTARVAEVVVAATREALDRRVRP
jgi:Zn-dependent M28 family amino/carboxypeptidase